MVGNDFVLMGGIEYYFCIDFVGDSVYFCDWMFE